MTEAWDNAYKKIDEAIQAIPVLNEYIPLIEHLQKISQILELLEMHHSGTVYYTPEQRKDFISSITKEPFFSEMKDELGRLMDVVGEEDWEIIKNLLERIEMVL